MNMAALYLSGSSAYSSPNFSSILRMNPFTLSVPRRKIFILGMLMVRTSCGSWALIESTIISLASSMTLASLGLLRNTSNSPFLRILRMGIPAMTHLVTA